MFNQNFNDFSIHIKMIMGQDSQIQSAFIASYFGDELDDFSGFAKYNLIVDASRDEVSPAEIFTLALQPLHSTPRLHIYYDFENVNPESPTLGIGKLGFDVNLDFISLEIDGEFSFGMKEVIDVLKIEANKYFARIEYNYEPTQSGL